MTTALAAPIQNTQSILAILRSPKIMAEVENAIPKFMTAERMVRITCTTISKTPKLAECTPQSLLSSLMVASAMGIEPDGRNGHLIPRWNKHTAQLECSFQPDYKGLIGLVRKNEDVADIYAELVCEADEFAITKGLHRDIIHAINIRKPRGTILGAYAVIQFKAGNASFEFMQIEEIENHRARSQSPNAGPWVTDFGEMCKKTVFLRLMKTADLSGDTADRLTHDVEATVTRGTVIETATVPAQIEDRQAALPAPTEPAAPAAALPQPPKPRAARVAKPVEPVAPVEPAAPAPLAEPTPEAATAEPTAALTPEPTAPAPASMANKLRGLHAAYTDEEILAALLFHKLIPVDSERIEEAPEVKLGQAVADPDTFGKTLVRLRAAAIKASEVAAAPAPTPEPAAV